LDYVHYYVTVCETANNLVKIFIEKVHAAETRAVSRP